MDIHKKMDVNNIQLEHLVATCSVFWIFLGVALNRNCPSASTDRQVDSPLVVGGFNQQGWDIQETNVLISLPLQIRANMCIFTNMRLKYTAGSLLIYPRNNDNEITTWAHSLPENRSLA